MTPVSWAGLLGSVIGVCYLIAPADEPEAALPSENSQTSWRGGGGQRSALTTLAERSRREVKPRPAKVIFVDDPDDLLFFEDQIEGKSAEVREMFQGWMDLHNERQSLQAEGLGRKHPTVVSLADREVLVGNRLNQKLRNESQ